MGAAVELPGQAPPEAQRLGEALARRHLTVATAESMTGGAVAEAMVVVPGSSDWLAGGVIAYQSRVKFEVLGVRPGPVICREAACAMAEGVARLLGTDVGIATTGVAGPEPMEDSPVGTAWVAVWSDGKAEAQEHHLQGTPEEIRTQTVRLALELATNRVGRR